MNRDLTDLLRATTPADSEALRANFRVQIQHAQSMAGIPSQQGAGRGFSSPHLASTAPKPGNPGAKAGTNKKSKRAALKLAKMKQPKPKRFAAILSVLAVLACVVPLGVAEFFASKAKIEKRVVDKNTEKVIHAIKAQAAQGKTTIEVVLP